MSSDPIEVRREQLGSQVARGLILALNQELSQRYPEEAEADYFRLDPDEVAAGQGAFLVAYRNQTPLGCGAVRRIATTTAELKRMYVDPGVRGQGVGAILLLALEAEARRIGATDLVLETGQRQPEAIALYAKAGFAPIPPFGDYLVSPLSVFLGKRLGPAPAGTG